MDDSSNGYDFSTHFGLYAGEKDLVKELAELYSNHYGTWSSKSKQAPHPGERVKLSPDRIQQDYLTANSCLVIARDKKPDAHIVGYAIAIQAETQGSQSKKISWVTQFVVHTAHRNKKLGEQLLFSLWGCSDHDAWGILTANPYAIRALEKATCRRCDPKIIMKHSQWLRKFSLSYISYIEENTTENITNEESTINTKFYVDHSDIKHKITQVSTKMAKWTLGPLKEGWEWFAFTFKQQPPFPLKPEEINRMLNTSDAIVQQAYAKMDIANQKWAQYTEHEINYILNKVALAKNEIILDLGCGNGRHSQALRQKGFTITAVDYVKNSTLQEDAQLKFYCLDIRELKKRSLPKSYSLVLCLYDVIGTYIDDTDNLKIIQEIYDHLKPGGHAFISVMNLDYLLHRNVKKFRRSNDYKKLQDLPASGTMQNTGNIFSIEKILLDEDTNTCYRREQFRGRSDDLPREFIVRDKRFTKSTIEQHITQKGFIIEEIKYVKSGQWDQNFTPGDGKEILILCKKPDSDSLIMLPGLS